MEAVRLLVLFIGFILLFSIFSFYNYTGSFVYPESNVGLMSYSGLLLLFASLFLIMGATGRFGKYLSKGNGIVLVGESSVETMDIDDRLKTYNGLKAAGSNLKELYESELYNTLKLIEESKPGYVFLERINSEKIGDAENKKLMAIYKKAKEIGAKVIPLDERLIYGPNVELREKIDYLSNVSKVLKELGKKAYGADRNPDRLRELNQILSMYPVIGKTIGIEKLTQENLNDFSKHVYNEFLKLYYKLKDIEKVDELDKSSRWARLISDKHKERPDSRALVIIDENHLKDNYVMSDKGQLERQGAIFPKLLKEYDLRYEKVSVAGQALKELKEKEKQLYKP